MDRLRFHAQTAAVLGGSLGGAWVAACGLVAISAVRLERAGEALLPPSVGGQPALVLGCRPGPGFQRRLDAAAALFRAGRTARVVVSGRGESAYGAAHLRQAGLPADCVVEEPKARNTWENLAFGAPLLGPGAFLLVTDRWHLPRAVLAARSQGLVPVPVGARGPFRPKALAREGLSAVMSVSGGHVPLSAWLALASGAVGERDADALHQHR